MPGKRFRVAICGGGIGGLTAAVALSKYSNIDVEIYEAATQSSQSSEVGADIAVSPRLWRLLAQLGLAEDLAKETTLKPNYTLSDTLIFRRSDQPEGLDFYKLQTEGNFLHYSRPDFVQVIMGHLPPSCKMHFSKRLHSYTEQGSGHITLYFMDNSTAVCDILIGADGIKSAVRRSLLIEKSKQAAKSGRLAEAEEFLHRINPRWTGVVAYQARISTERLKAYRDAHPDQKIRIPGANSTPYMYMGRHMNVVVYPVSSGKMINVGAFHAQEELAGTHFPGPWEKNVETNELLAAHAHWEPELQGILRCVENPSRWAIHASRPLPSWVSRNVALLGDAAHAMSPQQESGAGQAIEDAYVLAVLLGHPLTRLDNASRALSIYDMIRRPIAMEVAERSLTNGRLFGLQLPGVPIDDDPQMLPALGEAIENNWKWAWSTTCDGAVKEAIRLLEVGQETRANL